MRDIRIGAMAIFSMIALYGNPVGKWGCKFYVRNLGARRDMIDCSLSRH